jgi:hypothetical protein
MPDLKISDLPAATTPLTGTEQVALVQGGITKKGSVTDINDNTSEYPVRNKANIIDITNSTGQVEMFNLLDTTTGTGDDLIIFYEVSSGTLLIGNFNGITQCAVYMNYSLNNNQPFISTLGNGNADKLDIFADDTVYASEDGLLDTSLDLRTDPTLGAVLNISANWAGDNRTLYARCFFNRGKTLSYDTLSGQAFYYYQ